MESSWLSQHPTRGRCAIAAKALPAGTAVPHLGGAPYASLPLPSHHERLCARCFSQPAKLMRCTRCKWARYCCAACQRADWPDHKHECRALAVVDSPLHSLPDAACADLMLAARCLRRRHGNGKASSSSSDSHAAFDALEAGEPSESDLALAALGASFDGLLPPLANTTTTLAATLGAFTRNNFGVLNDLLFVTGAGCYPNTALLNHSCAPTCVLAFDGPRVEVRTLRAVAAGEELTHSYVDLCLPTAARQATLQARYGFMCTCPRCVDAPMAPDGVPLDTLLADGSNAAEATAKPSAMGSSTSTSSATAPTSSAASPSSAALTRATALLDAALHEADETRERNLTIEALTLRRAHCHPLSAALYEAEGRALSLCLAVGDLDGATRCCRQSVFFLEAALAHVPAHPLLALQRFTLSDLERQAGQFAEARRQMEACVAAVEVSSATASALRAQARAVLDELRGGGEGGLHAEHHAVEVG